MIIRKGKKKDSKECIKLSKLDKESYWKSIDFEKSATDKDVVFLVAENDKKIIGYILGFIVPTKRTEALIHETRVDKRERGKQIGTKLVDAFCKEIFKRKVKDIYAEIEPDHLKFYRDACKFKVSGKWIEVAKRKK